MLLLYLGVPTPDPDIPDVVTVYYPSESGLLGVEYVVNGTRHTYQYVASQSPSTLSYRVEPTRR